MKPAVAKKLVEAINDSFLKALSDGHPAIISQLYEPGGVYLPADGKVLCGRDEIYSHFKKHLDARPAAGTELILIPIRTWASGDLIVQCLQYELRDSTPPHSVHETGSQVMVFQQKENDELSILVDIENIQTEAISTNN